MGIWDASVPIEEVITEAFIPTLVGDLLVDYCSLWRLMALLMKRGGMGFPNPVATADLSYLTLVKVTWTLIEAIQKEDPEAFDLVEYNKVGQVAKEMAVGGGADRPERGPGGNLCWKV